MHAADHASIGQLSGGNGLTQLGQAAQWTPDALRDSPTTPCPPSRGLSASRLGAGRAWTPRADGPSGRIRAPRRLEPGTQVQRRSARAWPAWPPRVARGPARGNANRGNPNEPWRRFGGGGLRRRQAGRCGRCRDRAPRSVLRRGSWAGFAAWRHRVSWPGAAAWPLGRPHLRAGPDGRGRPLAPWSGAGRPGRFSAPRAQGAKAPPPVARRPGTARRRDAGWTGWSGPGRGPRSRAAQYR